MQDYIRDDITDTTSEEENDYIQKETKKNVLIMVIILVLYTVAVFTLIHFLPPETTETSGYGDMEMIKKPVIYLYGYDEYVNVQMSFNEQAGFTCTYPEYKSDGWTVRAYPDGHLRDKDGKNYRYLYWEGEGFNTPDFSTGYCVRGEYTASFLEVRLKELGLNEDEMNDFITYWLPQMKDNRYNIITFQNETYKEAAKMDVNPSPDTIVRVFMTWYPSDSPVEIKPQVITSPHREGRCVVEWGGCECAPKNAVSEGRRLYSGLFKSL